MTADTFLPNPQPPDIFHQNVTVATPLWQIFFVVAAAVAVAFLLERLYNWLSDQQSDQVEDATDAPERHHDAIQRAADVIDRELANSTTSTGTIGDRPFFGENVAYALADYGLIRGAGWTPPPRNYYVGDDGEIHPIHRQTEKVSS